MSTEASAQHETRKCRAKLTGTDVIKIFELKLRSGHATEVASMFGVSEKAIRDIWTARTWAKETWHLEPSRALVIKQTGRPRGRKDSKPRKMKASMPLRASLASCFEAQQIESGLGDSHLQLGEEDQVGLDYSFWSLQHGSERLSVPDVMQSPSNLSLEAHRPSIGITVDEQLGEWNADIWSNPRNADPFELDWQRS